MIINLTIQINEKEPSNVTVLQDQTPNQIVYNEYSIKRKYFKKWELGYKRKPMQSSMFSKSDKTVKQEPLLEPHC